MTCGVRDCYFCKAEAQMEQTVKVGQVWKDKEGLWRVTHVDPDAWQGSDEVRYEGVRKVRGRFVPNWQMGSGRLDFALQDTLVYDPPPEPPPGPSTMGDVLAKAVEVMGPKATVTLRIHQDTPILVRAPEYQTIRAATLEEALAALERRATYLAVK